jgi:hypothetical protein
MDGNRYEETYRGHGVCVEADERRPGCWGWAYLIDGRISAVSRAPICANREKATAQGLAAAHARIDTMLARPGGVSRARSRP